MDCSPSGFSVHGIFQARVLERAAIAFSVLRPEKGTKLTVHLDLCPCRAPKNLSGLDLGNAWNAGLTWDSALIEHPLGLGEGGNRTGSILKAELNLGPDCGFWVICPVSMETTYQLENQAPRRKSPRALHLLKEYPNYLCNRIIHSIMLIGVWPQAYW